MKTVKQRLLATSALVAAASMAGGAANAEAMKPALSVSGYYYTDFHMADVDGSDADGVFQQNDAEVHFNGSGELDNGIKIAAKAEFEVLGGGDTDEHWVSLSNGWGTVRLGATDGVSNKTAVGGPNGGYGVTSGVQTEWFKGPGIDFKGCAFRCTLGGTNLDAGNDDQGVHYFSPRFSGFQFAVSYRPSITDKKAANAGPVEDESIGASPTSFQNAVDGAVRYNGELGGVGISASVGTGMADGGEGGPDYEHVVVGLSLSAMGFTVGGRMANEGTESAHNGNSFGAGVSYGQGPWKVGADVFSGSIRGSDTPGDDEYNAWAVSGTYTVGPGLRLIAGFQSASMDPEGDAASVDGSAFTAGVAVNF